MIYVYWISHTFRTPRFEEKKNLHFAMWGPNECMWIIPTWESFEAVS